MMDAEGTSDVFCRGFFDPNDDVQETDTHYRNQDGKPDFQYRLIFQVKDPPGKIGYKFTLQMYDRDWVILNKEMIGTGQLDLKKLVKDCGLVKKPLTLNKKYYSNENPKVLPRGERLEFDVQDPETFWLPMMYSDGQNDEQKRGKVRMRIDVLPISDAQRNKVGKAREQPNHSPVLPEP